MKVLTPLLDGYMGNYIPGLTQGLLWGNTYTIKFKMHLKTPQYFKRDCNLMGFTMESFTPPRNHSREIIYRYTLYMDRKEWKLQYKIGSLEMPPGFTFFTIYLCITSMNSSLGIFSDNKR